MHSPDLQTILLATDFAERSRRAEGFAVALAARCDATLVVIHAIEPIMGVDDQIADDEDFDEFYDSLLSRADREIDARTDAWDERNLTVKHHVQIGHRWQVILEQAEAHGADIVVLGRRSFADRPVPLGTTSQKVFFGCTRPVLFIPDDAE